MEESYTVVAATWAAACWLPGAVSVSRVRVYDWPTTDGLNGGSPHLHTTSDEGYLVLSGDGIVQTLSQQGFQEHSLAVDRLVWFTAGTVHRLVAGPGGLEVLVLMQNAGLPEAGDAVLTFPPEVLAEPERYDRAARLPPGTASKAAAQARRDLAVEGFVRLRAEVEARGVHALDGLYRAAAELVRPRLSDWRRLWRTRAMAQAELTGRRLDLLAMRSPLSLEEARVRQVVAPSPTRFGLCGMLISWDVASDLKLNDAAGLAVGASAPDDDAAHQLSHGP